MKFSVAAKIKLPDGPAEGPAAAVFVLGAGAVWEACSTVAGSPIRRRSVARGHSSFLVSLIQRAVSKLTPHVRLKDSRSPNSLATVSSPRLDLYCFNNRVHVSVYSASVTASLI